MSLRYVRSADIGAGADWVTAPLSQVVATVITTAANAVILPRRSVGRIGVTAW